MTDKKCDQLPEKREFFSGVRKREARWGYLIEFKKCVFLILEASKFYVSQKQYKHNL